MKGLREFKTDAELKKRRRQHPLTGLWSLIEAPLP